MKPKNENVENYVHRMVNNFPVIFLGLYVLMYNVQHIKMYIVIINKLSNPF